MTPPSPSRIPSILPPPFAWVEIPAGEVTLVEQTEPRSYIGERGEPKAFPVDAFTIAKYPVTNAQFALFLLSDGYFQKKWWTKSGWNAKTKHQWISPLRWLDQRGDDGDHPVVGVSWYEALAFCGWLSDISGERITLPTEQQWQRAAQGDDGRLYPWGNEWDAARCNHSVGKEIDWEGVNTSPVTQYAGQDKGDSPFGVSDMAGNVWEYCLTAYELGNVDVSVKGVRVMRGGSWRNYDSPTFCVAERRRHSLKGRSEVNGFRIVLAR